jgi:hypothetical protein
MTFEIDTRYLKGKVYKIVCNVTDDIYYGSTILTLKYRLAKHKTNYNQYKKGKKGFQTSFNIIERGNYNIYLVENYPCLCKSQLHNIERVYIEKYKCVNKILPIREKGEWDKLYYEKYRDNKLQYQREYYQKNKHKKLHYQKLHYQKNRDRILNRQKKYYKKNKHKK